MIRRLLQIALLACVLLLIGTPASYRRGTPHIAAVHAMQPVIGIDIGSEFIKVGIARPRHPIDIVLNEQTKRKTPAVVAFRDGTERFLGESAKSLETRFPTSTLKYLNLLLAQRYTNINKSLDDNQSQELRDLFERYQTQWNIPIRLVRNRERGEVVDVIVVNRDTKKEQQRFAVEELLGMIFKYLRDLASRTSDSSDGDDSNSARLFVRDCVIAIPPFFSPQQRQGILDAAELAGLNVLSLVHDTTAALVQYGVNKYKTFLEMKADSKPHNVLVFDMGASATKVSVAQIRGPANENMSKSSKSRVIGSGLGRIDIKSVAWDQMVGGHDFDACLAEHFASEFEKKHPGKDVRSKPRVMARIMQQSQKVKEILSANTETFFYIESLVDDVDFRVKITRDEFHNLCHNLFARVVGPVKKAIESSGIPIKEFDSFELIGGSSRIPYVQQLLQEYLERDLSYSLNSDEAIALGATFRGANLSPYFRSKSFTVTDVSPYRIDFVLSKTKNQIAESDASAASDGSDSHVTKARTLFKAGDATMSKKTINVPRTEDFTITLRYGGSSGVPPIPMSYTGNQGDIEIIKVVGVEQAMQNFTGVLQETKDSTEPGAKTKVRVSFKLDSNGLLVVEGAQATLERVVRVKVKDSEQQQQQQQNSTATGYAANEDKEHNREEHNVGEEEKKKNETKFKKQKVFSRVALEFERKSLSIVQPMSAEMKSKANDRLRAMDKYDDKKTEMARQRNTLESMLYSVQYEFLEDDDLMPFFNDQQKQELLDLLALLEEQLDAESRKVPGNTVEWFEKSTADYMERIASIQKLMDPIKARHRASTDREREFGECGKIIESSKALLTLFEKTAQHITAEELQDLATAINETQDFVEQKRAEQEASPLYKDPVVHAADLRFKCTNLSAKALALSKKPIPEPVVVNDEDKKEDNGTAEAEEATTTEKTDQGGNETEEETTPTNTNTTPPPGHQKDEL